MAVQDYMDKIIYFFNSVYGKFIPIYPIKVSNTRSKKLRKRTPGKSPQRSDTDPKDTKISDRLKIENVYEVDGYIKPIGSSDTDVIFFPTEKTAKEVKDDFLKYVFNNNAKLSNVMTMHYEGKSMEGTIEKVDITEEATDRDPSAFPDSGSIDTDDEKERAYLSDVPRYSIKFIFVAIDNTI